MINMRFLVAVGNKAFKPPPPPHHLVQEKFRERRIRSEKKNCCTLFIPKIKYSDSYLIYT